MLITTNPPRRRAASTRERWPSCSAPIVGTKETASPRARAAATAARTSAIVVTTFMSEAVLWAGILAATHVARESLDRAPYVAGQLGVALEELGSEPVVES